MLLNAVITETMKYKRTVIPWLILTGGFFPALVALLFLLTGDAPLTWASLYASGFKFMNMLALLLVSVFAGHAFIQEFSSGGMARRAYPVPGLLLYTVKIFIALLQALIMYIVFFAFLAASGVIFANGQPAKGFVTDMAVLLLLSAAANFSLVPLTAAVSILARNAGAYILAGIGYFVAYMMFAGSDYAGYMPPCVPDNLLNDYFIAGKLFSGNTPGMLPVCAAIFFTALCLGAVCYCRLEI